MVAETILSGHHGLWLLQQRCKQARSGLQVTRVDELEGIATYKFVKAVAGDARGGRATVGDRPLGIDQRDRIRAVFNQRAEALLVEDAGQRGFAGLSELLVLPKAKHIMGCGGRCQVAAR